MKKIKKKYWIDINDTKGVQGTKFIYGEWNQGMLVLNDSLFFMQDYLAYDAYDEKILIKKEKAQNAIFEVELQTKFAKTKKEELPKANFVLQSGPIEFESYGKYVCELRDSKKIISKIYFHVVKPSNISKS